MMDGRDAEMVPRHVRSVILQLILLGVSAIFRYGFAVAYGPVFGIPQVILIQWAHPRWPALSRCRRSARIGSRGPPGRVRFRPMEPMTTCTLPQGAP